MPVARPATRLRQSHELQRRNVPGPRLQHEYAEPELRRDKARAPVRDESLERARVVALLQLGEVGRVLQWEQKGSESDSDNWLPLVFTCSPWYHTTPLNASGPTANGAMFPFQRHETLPGVLQGMPMPGVGGRKAAHCATAADEDQTWSDRRQYAGSGASGE